MKNARKSPWRLLYKFHRYTGLAVALIAIILSMTGIALNHTEDLQLDRRFVRSPALLDWYGIKTEAEFPSFKTGNFWLSLIDGQVYLNDKPVFNTGEPLVGAIATDQTIVAAGARNLTVLSLDGEIIEQINRPSEAIALADGRRILIKNDNQIWYSDDDLLSWQPTDQQPLHWSTQTTMPARLKQRLSTLSRQNILPYERVFLDLHSGRLFGYIGVWIVDLTGVLLILLAISGTWIWLRHKLKSSFHKRKIR